MPLETEVEPTPENPCRNAVYNKDIKYMYSMYQGKLCVYPLLLFGIWDSAKADVNSLII